MLKNLLIGFVPEFENYWNQDIIFQEDNKSYTEHDVAGCFLEYYQVNYEKMSILILSTLCIEFEKILLSDPEDKNDSANAICTSFLEMLVDTPAGDKIERYLGVSCKEYWNYWKS